MAANINIEFSTALKAETIQVSTGNFLRAVQDLSEGHCDYIEAPDGAILHLDNLTGLAYSDPMAPKGGIYFFVETYLQEWKMLKRKTSHSFV
jgi:hypothetical protein